MENRTNDIATCPVCGNARVALSSYDSLLVLRKDFALFSLVCPNCSTRFSTVREIPDQLKEEVYFATVQIGTGWGTNE